MKIFIRGQKYFKKWPFDKDICKTHSTSSQTFDTLVSVEREVDVELNDLFART
jgi:uncharacterized membrane protein YfbV (UPF0208 family)